jgi:NodT family efflux transporter outer membrane factor (OMF) lipoprotein
MLSATLLLAASTWWTAYGDPELNALVEKVIAKNIDLQTAAQRISEARAVSGESRSKWLPTVNATTSAQTLRGGFAQGIARIPQGGNAGGSFVAPFETGILQGGMDMKWELDLFGANRAGRAAALADVSAREQHRDDLAITLAAEAARYYVELRGVEDRLAITRRNLTAQRDLLALTEDRTRAGLASQLDVERQQTLLSTTEATVPPLEADREAHLHRLAVLVDDQSYRPGDRQSLTAPSVEGTFPGELLQRRPDVREAEARLTAALSRLKQARTDRYPKITLNGLLGRQGTSLSTLSFGGGNFFSLGPQVQLPLFNGGRIAANIAANDARVEQERLAYRKEILSAFEESANALSAARRQREREGKLAAALGSARRSLELAADLQKAGLSDFLAVLDAERAALDAEYQTSAARTLYLIDTVALYKALAGGWPQ